MTDANAASSWHLNLTLTGIGGAFDADRGISNTGALLEIVEGEAVIERVLIDCGHTCGRSLDAMGLTYKDIDRVLVTHAHGDHIDGLEVLGYKSLFLYNTLKTVTSPASVLEMIWDSLRPKMGRLQTAKGESTPVSMATYFRPDPVATGTPIPLAGGRLTATFFPVVHVHGMPAHGIILDLGDGGPQVRWSGDCTFDVDTPIFDGLDPERGDRVFHDCLIHPYIEATVHTHLEELERLPEETRRATVLIHHGKVEEAPSRRAEMILGQPGQCFRFAPG